MTYTGLNDFIWDLEKNGELQRIKTFVNPVLEISEITDRVSKAGGKALLFENTGTKFPVLINTFGSSKRMSLALGQKDLQTTGKEIEKVFASLSGISGSFINKIIKLPDLIKLSVLFLRNPHSKGNASRLFITIQISEFCRYLNAGLMMPTDLSHFQWFIQYILRQPVLMSECTGCRFLIKRQQVCTGSCIRPVQTILKHGKE